VAAAAAALEAVVKNAVSSRIPLLDRFPVLVEARLLLAQVKRLAIRALPRDSSVNAMENSKLI
jgi:hypothetical protein